MAQADLTTPPAPRTLDQFGQTARSDSWWAGSLATGLGLGAFIVYSTFRALYNGDYVSFDMTFVPAPMGALALLGLGCARRRRH